MRNEAGWRDDPNAQSGAIQSFLGDMVERESPADGMSYQMSYNLMVEICFVRSKFIPLQIHVAADGRLFEWISDHAALMEVRMIEIRAATAVAAPLPDASAPILPGAALAPINGPIALSRHGGPCLFIVDGARAEDFEEVRQVKHRYL